MVEYLGGVNQRFVDSDAAIMLVLDYEGNPALSAVPLPKVETFLLAHRDHPLNRTSGPIGRNALAEHVELVVADSAKKADGERHRLFLGSPHLFEMSDFYSKRQAILNGVGYGWLPGHLAAEHMESGELVQIPFEEGTVHTFEPHLVYRNEPLMGLAGRLFIDLLLQEAGHLQAAA